MYTADTFVTKLPDSKIALNMMVIKPQQNLFIFIYLYHPF